MNRAPTNITISFITNMIDKWINSDMDNSSDIDNIINYTQFLIQHPFSNSGKKQRLETLIPYLKNLITHRNGDNKHLHSHNSQYNQISDLLNQIRDIDNEPKNLNSMRNLGNDKARSLTTIHNGRIMARPENRDGYTPGAANTTPGLAQRCPEGYVTLSETPTSPGVPPGQTGGYTADYCSTDINFLQDLIDSNSWADNVSWRLTPLHLGQEQVWYEGRLLSFELRHGLIDLNFCANNPAAPQCQEEGYMHYLPISGAIPESIGNVSYLQHLHLGYNNIEVLPESIGNLRYLNHINMKYNNVYSLPESMGNYKNLFAMSFYRNNLSSIPRTLCNLEYNNWGNEEDFGGWDPPVLNLDYNELCDDYHYECLNINTQLFWNPQYCDE